MSRETARANLVAAIAALNSNKNWLKGVSQEYQVTNQPNGTIRISRSHRSLAHHRASRSSCLHHRCARSRKYPLQKSAHQV